METWYVRREGKGKGYYMVKERRSEGRERKRRRGTQRCAGRVAEEGWKVEGGNGLSAGREGGVERNFSIK